MKYTPILLCLFMLFLCSTIYADRGSIPFDPGARIFEPNQRAMIAWNGKEEILILTTDLYASKPTKVLEVLPLPAEPKVKKGDTEVFRKATALINSKLAARGSFERSGGSKGTGSAPAGEITFHKKIGAHDIAVAHVLNRNGFVEWVDRYLRKAGVSSPQIPADLKEVIGEYIKDDFSWFVFDVVSLDKSPITNDAIQYRFATTSLFYPLKITRTEQGHTTVDLMVLTDRLLKNFPGLPIEQVQLPHTPIAITSKELKSLSPDIDELMGHREDLKLRIWKITGTLSSFQNDLIAR